MKNFIRSILSVLHISPRPGEVSSLSSDTSRNPKIPETMGRGIGWLPGPYRGRWYDDDLEDSVFYEFNEGDRVIIFGNEPEPYDIGTFMGVDDRFKRNPMVRVESHGQVYMCMGIMLPFRQHFLDVLDRLQDIERWNYFVRPDIRLSEKYGRKYKTSFK